MSRPATFAIVTGGGTAGHVLPALAVAEALVANGHAPSAIHYVGARRGIETRLLPETPFPHTFLDVVGLQRRLTRRNLGFLPKLVRSARAATRLLRELGPRVVVSVGGYASLPAVLAARRLRIPIVVVSYDRFPGRASRFAARHAAACAVAFPDSPLPRATVTGAPLRRAVLDVERSRDSATARAALGLPPDRFVLAVMGGSQGSGILNDAVVTMLESRAADRGLAIRHAVGERFASDAPAPRDGRGGVLYQPVAYEPAHATRLRGGRPVRRTGRGEHRARGRRHGCAGDPRAMVGRRRGPSDGQCGVARRRRRRRPAPGAPDRRVGAESSNASVPTPPPARRWAIRPGRWGRCTAAVRWRFSSKPWL